jgi:hypothetical protein
VLQVVKLLSHLIPKKKLFPQKDISELDFKDLKKTKDGSVNVIAYKDKLFLSNAMKMLKTTSDIESQLDKVLSPLLIFHGDAD